MNSRPSLLVNKVPRLRLGRHATRHEAVPAGSTVRVVRVRTIEHQRIGCKLVNIGRVHVVSVAVRLELRPQVVTDEQQDVLPVGAAQWSRPVLCMTSNDRG